MPYTAYVNAKNTYLKELKMRAKGSRAYTKHQAIGVEIAELLGDTEHTSLYIKLAKEGDSDELLQIAKEVARRKGVKNKGAYFMRSWHARPRK